MNDAPPDGVTNLLPLAALFGPPGPQCERLVASGELLYRQVHPNFVQEGRPTSLAFSPFPKDRGLLSVDRSQRITAEVSYVLHTEGRGLPSAGVWAVTVGEVESAGSRSFSDPVEGPPPDPAHAVIDFRDLNDKVTRAVAKRLSRLAFDRGCVFPRTAA